MIKNILITGKTSRFCKYLKYNLKNEKMTYLLYDDLIRISNDSRANYKMNGESTSFI